nr:hypothetical protein [Tanacetum cinerariifolium]
MRKVGKGLSGVDTPLFAGMLVPQQAQVVEDATEDEDDVNETCATLTKQVANLKQNKIAQAIEIIKLKQRVKCLEKNRQFKSLGLKRLRKVWTAQRVESSADTVMDDQEDASKKGEGIAKLDVDEDVTLKEVDAEVTKDVNVQGRLKESQAKVYHLDLKHANKVLSMQETDEAELAEVEEVIEVVIAAKLMTEVVTIAATTSITAAPVPKASAPRRRRGVIIQDPEEAATASYTSPALTQKVFANMRKVVKGLSGVDTPLFASMLVPQQAQDVEDGTEDEDDVNEVSDEPTSPSPTPATSPPPPQKEHIPSPPQAETAQPSPPPQEQHSQNAEISMTLLNTLLETCATLTKQVANLEQNKIAQAIEIIKLKQRVKRGCIQKRGEGIAKLDADEDVTLEEVDAEVTKDETNEAEPAEVEEVIKVVTAAKLMIEVVTIAATTSITAAPVPKASAPRRRRGVIIQDPEEAATTSDEAFARELEAELNANINWNDVIDQAFLEKGEKEIEEEESKRKGENLEQKAAKRQKIDEEIEELRTHLQIVPNHKDDVYTEATPLALKVPVVDY